MASNNLAYIGQANTCTRELRLTVQALKVSEELFGMGHVKAGTVVLDAVHQLTVGRWLRIESDFGRFALAGALPGVAKLILENGLVSFRTMHLTPIATLVVAVLLGALLWVVVPAVIGRPLRLWEAFVVSAAILAILEWWRGRRLRREREQTESLRDSALW